MIKVVECKNVIKNWFCKPEYSTLKITKYAFLKVMTYANMAGTYEISGFGRIQNDTITDFKIIKQEVRSAYVEASENAVADFIRSIPKEELKEWKLDWHSHVDMNAFASSTDTDNYEEMLNLKLGKQFPAMIVNKSGDIELFNFISKKNMPDIELEILDEEITDEQFNEMYEQCKKDVEENCTVYKAPVTTKQLNFWSKENKTVKKSKLLNNNYYDDYDYGNWNNWTNYQSNKDETVCQSCGVILETDEELSRGICDDCVEAISSLNR